MLQQCLPLLISPEIRKPQKKGTHFRGQQVGRCGPCGSGHSSQGERCCKIHPRRNG
ncbi:hypothetical protein BOZ89_004987 [Escherichia coli]|nr:hypothetical protein [Escherichia coli]